MDNRIGIYEVGNQTPSPVLLYKSGVLMERIEAKYFYTDMKVKKRSLYFLYKEKKMIGVYLD